MGRYGLNGDAHLVLHRVPRESSQNLLTSDTAKWAGRLARPGLSDSPGPTPSPDVSRWPWRACAP